ncbi:MAG: 4'-phosphopantetheinyl transferase superfamily protein [Desulfobacterales bacterium]|nr:4'-phosphopantetheinyl transferase superfamily protein [Desulfobacterales bacterium]MDJ0883547.1 4'-phosphopantetheinyl transferase superfamily protein [Desulfobacterales bacterium]
MAGSYPGKPPEDGLRCLYPVVLSVPAHLQRLRGRPRVAILSRLARVAVRLSARLSGVAAPAAEKNDRGVPQPSAGIHWSLTHKPAFVAGVVAAAPVGIDIEFIRVPSEGLYRRIATAEEWRLGRGMARRDLFYRFWTAKEAVLKAEQIGLRGLADCRISALIDRQHMQLVYARRTWSVSHYDLPDHVAAVTSGPEHIQWQVDPGWSRGG